MLDCTHPLLHDVRQQARREQGEIAVDLINKYGHNTEKVKFIQRIAHASWVSSELTSRIWLGLWNKRTLGMMLNKSLRSPLTNAGRREHIKIIKALTAPLITAYNKIQDIHVHHTHTMPHIHDNNTATHLSIPDTLRQMLESTFIQDSSYSTTSHLNSLDHITHYDTYTLSNAAFGHRTADATV
jgi:hypothetical protein